MVDDTQLQIWFCEEVLPLEASLTRYLRKNWRTEEDVTDLRQDVYEAALNGARRGLPDRTQGYLFTIARNILINRAKRDRIVSFEQVADLESAANAHIDIEGSERHLAARDALRRAQAGMVGWRCGPVLAVLPVLTHVRACGGKRPAQYTRSSRCAWRKWSAVARNASRRC